MKKILLLLFALISINTFAQINVKEGSFRKIDGYLMLDKDDHRDINWKPMALIKITAEGMKAEERARLEFHGNAATFFDVHQMGSQTYLYISAQAATFLEIIHPDYGKTEYWFPEDLCDFCGYEMVVEYVPKVAEPTYGFLAISSEPSDANIYIDGKHCGKTNNVITDLTEGSHILKLEKEGFTTLTKNINITKGETLKLNETLQAVSKQKVHLIVKSDQENATIYIDDEPLGTKEASKLFMLGTTHTWMIKCNMYHTESGSLTLNERTVIDKKLRPNFGYLNVSTSPEQGAKVFVDEEYVGLSPIKTDKLKSGSHSVRVMKDMYKMTEKSFTVTDGQTTNATLNMTANFVNVTVNTDSQSDIYVDEEYKGKGKWTGRLSDGSHIFEARKANHKTSKKSVDLVLGETKTISIEAPKPINGEIEINSTPMGATIYIDGKSYGETPNYVSDIIIGEHELKLTKQGCAPITKKIFIKEGETLSVYEKLQSQQTTDNRQQTSGNNNVASGMIKGHEYVDLGLSVKWATCNVGANKPEEYGNYYAWGETTTKTEYSSSNSKTYGKSINDIKGNSQYDAARANWGGTWRLPTEAELAELKEECTWTWTTQKGIKGYKVTSKKNGNSIFLPAAGCREGSSHFVEGGGGEYWSSTPNESDTNVSCNLSFHSGNHYVYWYSRNGGLSVRPVSE